MKNILWLRIGLFCLLIPVFCPVLFGQAVELQIIDFRYREEMTDKSRNHWLEVADRWLEDDLDFNRFLLGKADFLGDTLHLVVLGYMSGGCWTEGSAKMKGDKILLTLYCTDRPAFVETVEVFELKLLGVEKKKYRIIVENTELDEKMGGSPAVESRAKLHQRAHEIRGYSYFTF